MPQNQKIQNTKAKLMRALCKLLQKKSLSDVNVSELCREAHVSRAAFYRHFNIPMDVLTEYFGDLFLNYVDLSNPASNRFSRESVYQVFLVMCQAYSANAELFQESALSLSDLTGIIRSILPGSDFSVDFAESGAYSYIAGGVYAIILQWARQGFIQAPSAIAKMLTEYTLKLLPNSPTSTE